MKNKRVLPALLGSVALTLGLVTVSTSINKEVVNAADEVTATLSFANTAQRTEFSTTKQVWEQNGITFTNNKAGSSNAVANYSKPVRLYQNSEIVVETSNGGNISKIIFDCNSSSYATALNNSISSGATVSSDKVTVTLSTPASSFTVAKLTAQVRLDAITVTYFETGNVPEIEPDKDVFKLVENYVSDGTYTKETVINLDQNSEELLVDFATLFHANKVPTLERITYYNGNELLMTDKEETFTSGYGTVTLDNISAVKKVNKNAEIGDLTHFTFNGETQIYDYIVKKNQQHTNWSDPNTEGMEGFYVTPRDFADEEYFQGWQYDAEDNYYFLEVENSDEIVNDFINVVAPLLLDTVLTSNYISVTSLTIRETVEGLLLQIIASGDSGKLVDKTTVLAEAMITGECTKDFSYVDSSKAVFKLGSNSSGGHSETSSAITSYEESSNGMVLSLLNPQKVYKNCSDDLGNSCLKLGTGSAIGSFSFDVPENVNKVVIYVAGYKSNNAVIKVNNSQKTISTHSAKGEYTAIEVDTSTNKTVTFTTLSSGYRCMINTIEFIIG